MDELFTRYMYYVRACKGIKSSTTEALRKFYEKDSYSLLKNEETFENLVVLAHFWEDISNQDKDRFSLRVLRRLFVLNYAPNGMWTYFVSVYFMQNKDACGLLDDDAFFAFLKKITAFIWTYAVINPGVNALNDVIVGPDLEAFQNIFLDCFSSKEDNGYFALAQEIRAVNSEVPIIFLTAKTIKEDILEGFKIGADDYITKPFSMEELVFRIEAILRRVKGKKGKEVTMYKIGRFTFDTQKQVLMIDDKVTKLTTKESELLSLLCAHVNEILERNYALKTIWIDDNYFNARSMDVYITKLRKHLKEDPSIEIINIHGKGYKLIAPESADK